jgi:hypothetical protein
MLEFYDANHIVMGHTPTRGVVFPRFDSRAIIVDVGLAAHYGSGMAALLIEKGKLSAIHRGEIIALPSSDDNLKAYFQKIKLLEPDPKYVQKMIELVDLPVEPIPVTKEETPGEVETAIPQ